MEPVGALWRSLQQQLVEVLLALVTDVEQDGGIAHQLLDARHANIRCTPRQVVRAFRSAHGLVHCLRSIPAVDDYRGNFSPPKLGGVPEWVGWSEEAPDIPSFRPPLAPPNSGGETERSIFP